MKTDDSHTCTCTHTQIVLYSRVINLLWRGAELIIACFNCFRALKVAANLALLLAMASLQHFEAKTCVSLWIWVNGWVCKRKRCISCFDLFSSTLSHFVDFFFFRHLQPTFYYIISLLHLPFLVLLQSLLSSISISVWPSGDNGMTQQHMGFW